MAKKVKNTKNNNNPDYTGMGIGFMNTPKYDGDKLDQQKYSQPISSKQYNDELVNSPEFINSVMNAVYGSTGGNTSAGINRFRPNPEMMYRGLGKAGVIDAEVSGVFRPKQFPKGNNALIREFDGNVRLNEKSFDKTYYAPSHKFNVLDQNKYAQGYIAEVPKEGNNFYTRYSKNNDWSQLTKREIPISEGRILQKDWLQGYIEVPKKAKGGYLSDQYLAGDYGLGSWLTEGDTGAQMASGAASGAIAGSTVGPWGTVIGGIAGGIGGMVKGRRQATQNSAANSEVTAQNNNNIIASRMAGYNQLQYLPTMSLGGDMDRLMMNKDHSNFMAAGGHLPEGNATLKEAKEFIKLFPEEMAMGEEVEYEHTGNKKLAQRIAADHVKDYLKMSGNPGYYSAMKAAGISDELNKMGYGGKLKPEKAKEILKDGTVHGKKLTDRQKRYFGFIAGGGTPKKANGGDLQDSNMANAKALYGPLFGKAYNTAFKSEETRNDNRRIYETNIGEMAQMFLPKEYNVAKKDAMNTVVNMDGKEVKRNVPPMDPVLSEIQGKLMNIPNKTTRELIGREYNGELGVKDVPFLLKTAKQADIGFKDAMKYWKHISGLKDQGYTFKNGGYFGQAYSLSGGLSDSTSYNEVKTVTEYKGGGTHEQNSLGGIPVGGKAKVEEGEVRVDFDEGSYIFSNKF